MALQARDRTSAGSSATTRLSTAVITVAYNSGDQLDACLESLRPQTRPPDDIVVVDNASTDGTPERVRVRFPEARLLPQALNLGYAAGNNLAASTVGTDVLVFVNDDVTLDSAWLQELIAPLERDPGLSATQSLLLLSDEPELINTSGTVVNYLGVGWCGQYRVPRQAVRTDRAIAALSGACFAIRRNVFLALGGFDEAYFLYHEDLDLSWRLLLAGGRMELVPTSIAFHRYRFRKPGVAKPRLNERNRLMTVAKNYRIRTLLLLSPAFTAAELGVCALALRQGWLGDKLLSYVDLARSLPGLLRRRQQVQATRLIPDAALAKIMVGTVDFEEIDHPLVRLGSRVLSAYWTLARRLIVW